MTDDEKRRRRAEKARLWREKNRERVRAADRARYLATREQRLAYEAHPERRARKAARMRAYRARNRELARLKYRAWNYGLTVEQVRKILEAGCGVCGSDDRLHIDHDHSCCPDGSSPRSCGTCVRGALCHGCNTALGLLRESPERIAVLLVHVEGLRLPGDRREAACGS